MENSLIGMMSSQGLHKVQSLAKGIPIIHSYIHDLSTVSILIDIIRKFVDAN